jgi:hypothetical protein
MIVVARAIADIHKLILLAFVGINLNKRGVGYARPSERPEERKCGDYNQRDADYKSQEIVTEHLPSNNEHGELADAGLAEIISLSGESGKAIVNRNSDFFTRPDPFSVLFDFLL